jgi:hypothetical protein
MGILMRNSDIAADHSGGTAEGFADPLPQGGYGRHLLGTPDTTANDGSWVLASTGVRRVQEAALHPPRALFRTRPRTA